MTGEIRGRAKGGVARAEALSPWRRKEIARIGAAVRWNKVQPPCEAIREGNLRIGNTEIQCYVLADETRVLARAGFVRAIGRTGKVKGGRRYDEELQRPVFLTAENLKPFWPDDLEGNSKPVLFSHKGQEMIGYRAELLADVCDVFQDAENAGVLRRNQEHIANACRLLSRGLTRVGIIGLVDEATGYQRDRAADALAEILEKFIAKELRPWVRTFPDEYYAQLFRLRGLEFPKDSIKKPRYFGHLTNDIIYSRLAPKALEELKNATPRTPDGRHKHQLHRRLTEDFGHPRLREHLAAVITAMQLSAGYDDFIQKLDRVKPRFDKTLPLPFEGQNLSTGL
jgi:hypothetical protein